ncbi:hypothetical protein TCDM_11008 [Trypanosoma cruzi Dm28c]|uniref:Uncharacterized protein n=1 Tax=Trypanosoma cruzi Dm28c TaxID=1416333 RepID=V5B1I2_TRYCR|nr:hypothetical protein TCDM_11008 [Trypanosoma cruzi Dm28c]
MVVFSSKHVNITFIHNSCWPSHIYFCCLSRTDFLQYLCVLGILQHFLWLVIRCVRDNLRCNAGKDAVLILRALRLGNGKHITPHFQKTGSTQRFHSFLIISDVLPLKLWKRQRLLHTINDSSPTSTAAAHHYDEEEQHRGSKHTPGHVGPLPLTLSSFPPPSAGSGHAATVVCAGCHHCSNT